MSAFSDVELLQDFLTEASDLLEDVDSKLVELEQCPDDANLLACVFRGFHTIKGGGGFLEATHLVELCHKTENLFDKLRARTLEIDTEMMDSILAATAEVHRMFGEMRNGQQPSSAPQELLNALDEAIEGKTKLSKAPPPPVVIKEEPQIIETISEVTPMSKPVVSAEHLNNELDWVAMYEAVVGVPPKELAQAEIAASMATEAISKQSASVVRESAPAVVSEPEPVAEAPAQRAAAPKPKAAPSSGTPQVKENTIRVDTARFDQILNLSGEIGLTKNRLNCLFDAITKGDRDEELVKSLDAVVGQLDMLVSDLQSAVMKARMQPVGRVFQKYSRLARDVARQLGKDVELVLEGAETEVDKSILEELNDPLVHLVRNAVDHGIETIQDRVAMGKSAKGTVNLSARQTGDHIVIEIQDDGRGMRPDIIRDKAVEKGLISHEEAGQLNLQETLQLIFLPGFSTKDQISDISGRGVGMDVVKTNIQRLNGRIEIESEVDRGSKITILLPLTLAILPVLMLKLEEQIYSLPLSCVREIITISEKKVQNVNGKPTMLVRGDVIPLLDLATLIGRESSPVPKVGVLTFTGNKACILAVDSLVGQDEVMIKPLDGVKPKGVAGATLSGEGLLVLVLELRELLEGRL